MLNRGANNFSSNLLSMLRPPVGNILSNKLLEILDLLFVNKKSIISPTMLLLRFKISNVTIDHR